MADVLSCSIKFNIGFISTRIAGTDGVSLEIGKWAETFEQDGFSCYYFAGEIDRRSDRSYLAEQAHFLHPDIRDIYQRCFGVNIRDRAVTDKIHEIKEILKDHLYRFIEAYNIELIVPQNALTIPLNIPLGLAITEVVCETGIQTIAHHHDFFWERKAFLRNAVWDFINTAFPPHLPHIQHVVINSSADNQLSLRTGASSTIIPNVMDFEHPPPPPDEYAADVRQALGIEDDELFILQPTRVVKRKGIEHAVELVHKLGRKARLVISHASGDEGHDYERRLKDYSAMMNVHTLFVSDIISERRGYTRNGRKIYTLYDVYPYADLVTYPSDIEGFGNAFLEAVYFRKPIVINTYSIYSTDIKPKGFKVIEMDGYVTDETVRRTGAVLDDPAHCREMVELNYQIAKRNYSYANLREKLRSLIRECMAHQS